jgi:RNA polymerase sigma-70 factor (ECF subfamily)
MDQHIIERAIKGNELAWKKISEYVKIICNGLGFKSSMNERDIEDLHSDVMVNVCKKLHTYQSKWCFSTWVHTIVKNMIIDIFRAKNRHKNSINNKTVEIEDYMSKDYIDPEKILFEKELINIINSEIDSFKHSDSKKIARLKFIDNFRYNDISDIVGGSIPKVKSAIFKSRVKIINRINETYDS